MAGRAAALWQCPRCGHEFVTKNFWHSCGFRGALWLTRPEPGPPVDRPGRAAPERYRA